MDKPTPLAQFLRARRSLVEPADVGVPPSRSPRRVAGLRREEVAMLAGISADYYLRLEQGRELHPSTGVLEGLTRALALDPDGAAHLHRLAHPAAPGTAAVDTVNASLIGLISSMPSIPAHVVNRRLDIIYINALGRMLSPAFRVGENLVKLTFHPELPRDAYWRLTAPRAVAYLRASVDPHDDGPEMTRLLEELRALDPAFEAMWARHETRKPAGHPSTFTHPEVGSIELRYQTFDLPGTGGQTLGMYVAAPGSPSAEKIQRLSLLCALNDPAAEGDRLAPRKSGGTTPA
ncbi:helix-turn-helix transcriptional regulator [Herbiconiux sp. VKM Ac-2851]|uniref:helix-turn-helix transcriptional regulator n=1 Tax=Herbiconiux sp. VKM Ac-2851 TaxID=2739025 RepID=UPI00156703D9|nr:helix-turn-helix transcriptional regulator [Herbiconiux sp. VKM Ac-2851]NQX36436.1 helix-turn-helix domain-containing protein [Herbiconiux sp. VKM Ac-2851]